MELKTQIIAALRAFVAQRPGFDPGNYADAASYRADMRTATRQRHDAERLLRDIEMRDSITAEDILREASGGRVDITVTPTIYTAETCTGRPCSTDCDHIGYPYRVAVHYTAGQYYCTEFRGAVARLLASVLWAWKRDHAMPALESGGAWLRASFRREYGRSLANRYFN